MQLTTEQRIFIVETYHETRSFPQVTQRFRLAFPQRNPPTIANMRKTIQRFQRLGTVLNQNTVNSGRSRTARTARNVNLVEQALINNPHVSSRRNGLGLSRSTFNRITRIDLNYHPYRMKIRHMLEPADHGRRIDYSNWLIQQFTDPAFRNKLVIGDEAAFQMNGEVYNYNVLQYAPRGQPPDFNFDRHYSREKVTGWAALCGDGTIFSPYFFDGNMNGDTYLNMINNDLVDEMKQHFNFD